MSTITEILHNPSPLNSAAYFWFINEKIDINHLIGQLHDMAEHGLKAVCFHPLPEKFRPRAFSTHMSPDYMTPEFLQIVKVLIGECKKLGMHYWLYDEGGWPSGSACGLVSAVNPEPFRQMTLARTPDGVKPVYKPLGDGSYTPNYPNLLKREVTDTFLRITHDQYYKTAPEAFGDTIRLAFQDEATFGNQHAWTPDMEQEFQQRKGYDITPYYEALLAAPSDDDTADVRQARIDLADVRSQLFVERFVKPVQDWCHAHGILSSGHFNGEHVPRGNFDYGHGHILRALRGLDAPGIDVIWRQLFPGVSTHHFPKYASSIARQNGSQLALSESGAVYGNGVTPQQLKWLVDFQLVRGITMFVLSAYAQDDSQHYLYALTRPQYGPGDPLWKYSALIHGYIERACALLTQGTALSNTAVLYDIPSIWAGASVQTNAIAKHNAIAKQLLSTQHDFDFIDDDVLSTAAIDTSASLPALVVGTMRYTHLVIPTDSILSTKSQETLAHFKAAGGDVMTETLLSASADFQPLVHLCPATNAIRATARQLADGTVIVFLVNETSAAIKTAITFPEHPDIASIDLQDGSVKSIPWKCGTTLSWEFAPYASAAFVSGITPDSALPTGTPETIQFLTEGWTLQPVKRHIIDARGITITNCSTAPMPEAESTDAAPVPSVLGNWNAFLGDTFSGDVVYTCSFTALDGPFEQVVLHLGDVKYACSIRLNGVDVGKLAWAPFECDISKVIQPGLNTLEVTVSNTLANVISDPALFTAWNTLYHERSNQYDKRERPFEAEVLPSGLYGPVSISYSILYA